MRYTHQMYISLKSLIESKHVTVNFESNRIQKRLLNVGMRRPRPISRKKKKSQWRETDYSGG